MEGVEHLTPVAQDYLKVIWSAVEWGEPAITTKGLAQRFATSQAAVSDTVRRLEAQGLVVYQPYKPVTLTPLGERLALAMVRRHRLVETFLATVLGYGWEEIHDDAERLEHAVSERMLTRMDTLLGHPRFDPHGDPIPAADGAWTPPADAERLCDVAPGRYRVVRVSDTDPDQLSRFRSLRVVPGAWLTVAEDGTPQREDGDGGDLDAALSAQVWVRPTVPAEELTR